MPNPTISSRPSLTPVFGGYTSKWNAGGGDLPIQYKIANTKFPTNSEDDLELYSAVTDDNGYAKLDMDSANVMVANDYVKVTGSVYNGVFKVKSKDTNDLTIDAPYSATDSGTAIRYLRNYRTVINVYAGINADHPFFYDDPIELIGTIEQKPDANNITSVDIHKYVKRKLTSTNDVGNETLPNDINGWCDFYIEYKELYDVAGAESGSGFVDDSSNFIGHAVNGALQFQNNYGGNYYAYVATPDQDDQAEWLTFFDNCFYIEGRYWDASIIHDTGEFLLEVNQYDENGSALSTEEVTYTGQGRGLYRIRADQFTLDSDATRFTLQLINASSPPTELYCYNIAGMTLTQSLNIRTITDGTNIQSDFTIEGSSIFSLSGIDYLFVCGRANSSTEAWIHKIQLGTNGTLTGAQWLQSVEVTTDITIPTSVLFNATGTEMSVAERNASVNSYSVYDLSVALDLSTLSNQAYISDGYGALYHTWNSDGTSIYLSITGVNIRRLDVATAYDIRGGFTNPSDTFTPSTSQYRGIIVDTQGDFLYLLRTDNAVFQYLFNAANTLSSLSIVASPESVTAVNNFTNGGFNSEGSILLISEFNLTVQEYSLEAGGCEIIGGGGEEFNESKVLSIDIGEPCKLNFGGAGGDLPGTGLPPDAPTLYSLGYDSDAETVSVIWLDNSADEIGFRLYRSSTGATAGYSLIAELPSDQSSYLDTGIAPTDPGTTYYYKVVAFNDQGFSDFSNVLSVEAVIPFPVDFSGAFAVFGTRVMVEGYSGAVIRGRRTSDNAEQDFTATEIIDGTLTTFASGSSVFVVTLYDQLNSNDVTQASVNGQGRLVNSGALQVDGNGVPYIAYQGSSSTSPAFYDGSSALLNGWFVGVYAGAQRSGSSIFLCQSATTLRFSVGNINTGGSYGSASTGVVSAFSPTITVRSGDSLVAFWQGQDATALTEMWKHDTTDGDQSGSNTIAFNTSSALRLVAGYGTNETKKMYGFVAYDTQQDSNRVTLMQGINDIYELGFTIA